MAAAINWEEVLALPTAALAVGAAITAYVAYCAYKTARKDLLVTQEQIDASRRPLLIDITRWAPRLTDLDFDNGVAVVKFPGDQDKYEISDNRAVFVSVTLRRAQFAVPLRNVGTGLAVIDALGVSVRGETLIRPVPGTEVQRERVPPGEMTRIVCEYKAHAPGVSPKSFEMRVPYTDLNRSLGFEAVLKLDTDDLGSWRVRSVTQIEVGRLGVATIPRQRST